MGRESVREPQEETGRHSGAPTEKLLSLLRNLTVSESNLFVFLWPRSKTPVAISTCRTSLETSVHGLWLLSGNQQLSPCKVPHQSLGVPVGGSLGLRLLSLSNSPVIGDSLVSSCDCKGMCSEAGECRCMSVYKAEVFGLFGILRSGEIGIRICFDGTLQFMRVKAN